MNEPVTPIDPPLQGDPGALALYVHWPWCKAKCPYCDFNSFAIAPEHTPQGDYAHAITRELDHYARQTPGRPLGSIYIGGGTPSLMTPETLDAILTRADRHWGIAADTEITIEANPTSVETGKLAAFRSIGANRVSIGVQAFNDADLQALGREHSARDAHAALDAAARTFDRFTFDLIYARPGQSLSDWERELTHALTLANGHVSLYQLTIEPGTDFHRSGLEAPDGDAGADFYALTQDVTRAHGLPAYEISNHARAGFESRHNLAYWQGRDYIGVGPGAHGRLPDPHGGAGGGAGGALATHQIHDPMRWLNKVNEHGHGTAKVRRLSPAARAEERLLAGLRLRDGIERERFRAQSGADVTAFLNATALDELSAMELVEQTPTHLRLSDDGRLVLNAVVARLLND